MLKTHLILEVQKGERNYQFSMAPDSSMGEIHDVLHEMKLFVVKTMTEKANSEVKTPENPKSPEPKEAE